MPNTIWVIFSVYNDYNQPKNNLEWWGFEKPSFNTIAEVVNLEKFPCNDNENTIIVVDIWSGKEQRVIDTDYRLVEIVPGKCG